MWHELWAWLVGKIPARLFRRAKTAAGPANESPGATTTRENDGSRPHGMMAPPTQGFSSALRGVSRNVSSRQWQQLDRQFQSLRLGQVVARGSRAMSTEAGPIRAAPKIDIKLLARRFRLAEHARAVPASPSYFSRTPRFNDRYLALQKLMQTYEHLPTIPTADAERVAWKTLSDLRQSFGEPVKATDYVKCLAIVKRLHQIHPDLKPTEVKEALEDFKRDVQAFLNVPNPIPIDKFGRALGVGRRKTSTARAFVVEGDGQVLVNGKSLAEYFGRVHDRESAVWALHATDRMDKYNVWARVEGGGTTGQAEALTLAIAKALLAHEPALKPALRRGGWRADLSAYRMHKDPADMPLCSRLRDTRPEKSGEEEAWPCEGEKEADMGQEMIRSGRAAGLPWILHEGSVSGRRFTFPWLSVCKHFCIDQITNGCTIQGVGLA